MKKNKEIELKKTSSSLKTTKKISLMKRKTSLIKRNKQDKEKDKEKDKENDDLLNEKRKKTIEEEEVPSDNEVIKEYNSYNQNEEEDNFMNLPLDEDNYDF